MYIMFCRDKSLSPTRKWIGKIDQSPPSSQSRFPQLNNYIQYRSEDCAALHLCQAQIRSNVFIEIKSGTVKDSGRSFLMEIPCGTKAINCFRIELRNGRDFLPSSNHCRCHSGTCAFFAWMRWSGTPSLPFCKIQSLGSKEIKKLVFLKSNKLPNNCMNEWINDSDNQIIKRIPKKYNK